MSVKATTLGGGYSAQADALKHGITKASALFELSLNQWVFLLAILESLSVKNRVKEKLEDLRNSQKDNYY